MNAEIKFADIEEVAIGAAKAAAEVASDPIGSEVPYLDAINQDDGGFGGFPAVQTLNNDGTPAGATAV